MTDAAESPTVHGTVKVRFLSTTLDARHQNTLVRNVQRLSAVNTRRALRVNWQGRRLQRALWQALGEEHGAATSANRLQGLAS